MNAGDTFRMSLGGHLWVVISDPRQDAGRVVLVNFSENHPWQDKACVLVPGDHPFLVKETCVFYAKARVETNLVLDAQLAAGMLVLHDPVDAQVLARMREGARVSRRMPMKHLQALVDQKVVEP